MSFVIPGMEVTQEMSGTGISARRPVRVATTAAGSLATSFSAGDVIDGITLELGDRILLKDQALASENGVWIVTAGVPERAEDYAEGDEVRGSFVIVKEGNVLEDTGWLCINDEGSDLIGTDDIFFKLFTGDVSGPGAFQSNTTDNAVVRWDGTTGTLIQNSGVLVDDSDNITAPSNIDLGGYMEINAIAEPPNANNGEGRLYMLAGDDGLYWKPDSGGPAVDLTAGATGGEANTGANVGIGGVGPFKQKVGTTLQFKNINAASARVTVTDDVANDEIDIDVDPDAILPTTTKGDIIVHNGTTNVRLPVGTEDQFLQVNSATATGLEWVDATGEANTASNIGAGGVGVFDGKVGVDLQFRNINAASSRVIVSNDALNNEIDIDADPDAILPTTTKGDLVVHNGSTNVRLPSGSNGEVLVADNTDPEGLIWRNPIIVQDEGVLVNNTPHTTLNFVGAGVTATDATNGVATITVSQGESNTASNIGVGGVGVFDGKVGVDLQFRNINAGPGGYVTVTDDFLNNEIDINVNRDTILGCTTKGELIVHNGTTHTCIPVGTNGQFLVADSTDAEGMVWRNPIIVQDEGINVTNTPHTTINFIGAGLTAVDGGAGVVNVTGTGEGNTGSNVGVGGVGVFDGKVGVDLQFKNINAGSSAVTVTDDAANNEIDIDVDRDVILGCTTKGELIVHNGTTHTCIPVGLNNQVLVADNTDPEGVVWRNPVTIQEEGSGIAGTPHHTLNFVGATVTATDAGSGIANITISNVGEANTASNIGVGGVGVFDGKVGVDLQFRNINAGSSRVTVVSNGALDTIDIDVDPDQILPTTTKGDIIVHNGTTNVRLPVGSDGQILVANSLDPEGIEWVNPSGVDNTASNIGVGGVGVFDGKVGIDLQFRNINDAGSGRVVVTLDGPNNEIDLDVDPDAVLPTTTKGDIIVHNGTTNVRVPVGLNGQVLVADNTDPEGLVWRNPLTLQDEGGNITGTPHHTINVVGSFISIADAGSGIATLTSTAEANTASNIGVGGVGVFDQKVGADLQFRNINAGSSYVTVTDDAANNEIDIDVDRDAILGCTTKGEIIVHNGTTHTCIPVGSDGQVLVADSTDAEGMVWRNPITVQDEGSLVTNTPHQIINFTGLGVTATDSGAGVIEVNIPAAPGGGEANTASNIGVGGVGVFDQKVGVDLQFRNINAGSSAVTVTDDAANNEIDIDVDRDVILGCTTKGEIIVHNGTTHTCIPVGTDKQVLVANAADAEGVIWANPLYVEDAGVAVTNTPHHTLNFTGPVTVTDATGGVATVNIDAESNTASNIGVGGVGVFDQKVGSDLQFRNINAGAGGYVTVVSNDALDTIDINVDRDAILGCTTKGELIVHNGTTHTCIPVGTNGQFLVADSTDAEGMVWRNPIIVQDEGVNVTGTPHTTLNFVGGGIAATNAGSGVVNVTVSPTGETNTASNIGVGGVGVFDSKVGSDLQFRNINDAGAGRIVVALDAINNEIDIDVDRDAVLGCTTKGEIIVHNGTTHTCIPVGTDYQVLTALASDPEGVVWADPSIKVRDEGVALTGAPHTTLNFVGAGVTASNAGGGVTNVTVPGGQFNTASNIGVGGVGPYAQKVGVDLQFRNINAGSSAVTVTLDAPNNEIDIDVDRDVILGCTTKGEIIVHNGTTHTCIPVGSNGQILVADSTDAEGMVWQNPLNVQDEGVLVTNGPHQIINFTGAGVTAIDSGAGVVEVIIPAAPGGGEANTASNIGVGGVGVFDQKVGSDLQFRNINAGSSAVTVTDDAANNEIDIDVDRDVILGCTTKGEIIVHNGTTHTCIPVGSNGQVLVADNTDPEGIVWRNPITVQDEGTPVTNTPHTTLNFTGTGVTVTDGGAGVATVNIGAGEANTASNIGVGGVGVFDQKVGVDLQFRNINAGSNKVTVTDDAANNEIDIDVVEANIDHDALLNFVANEHIDHSTVSIIAGEGLAGGGDLTATRTIDLDFNELVTAAPDTAADYLAYYDASTGDHKKVLIDNLGYVTESTINLEDEGAPVTATPHSILNFIGPGVTVTNAGSGRATISIPGGETNTASNIGVGGVGVFDQKVGVDFQFRNINSGSAAVTVTDDAANNEIDIDVDRDVILGCTTKGEIIVHNGTTHTCIPVGTDGQILVANSADPEGIEWQNKDAQTIIVRDEGVIVTGGPHNTLNFIGTAVTATNAGGGIAAITINAETNTASNIGVGGVGVFDQKVGVDLQFRNINAGAGGYVTVTDDAANNEIDINVDRDAILGCMAKGDIIVYNGATHDCLPTGTNGQYLVANNVTATGLQWQDLPQDAILVQDEGVNVIGTPHTTLNFVGSEVTATNGGGGIATITVTAEANTASNIGVGGVGVFDQKVGADLQFRNINAAPGGRVTIIDDAANNEIDIDVNRDVIMGCTTKGEIIVHNGTTHTCIPVGTDGQVLTALASDPEGIVWAAPTINVRDEGTLVANTPHSTLNFIGAGVTATDAGGGQVNITVTSGGGGEANTASNIGTAGVGVFKQKTGVDLEFKKLNSISGQLTITDNVAQNRIDFAVGGAVQKESIVTGSATAATTTSTTLIPMPNMLITTTFGGIVLVNATYVVSITNGSNQYVDTQLRYNGVVVPQTVANMLISSAGETKSVSILWRQTGVSIGDTFEVWWRMNGNKTAQVLTRTLMVETFA